MSHLTDIEIALLATRGDAAARSHATLAHLMECDECTARLAACVRAAREDEQASNDEAELPALRAETGARLRAGFEAVAKVQGWDRRPVRVRELYTITEPIALPREGSDESWAVAAAASPVRDQIWLGIRGAKELIHIIVELSTGVMKARLMGGNASFGSEATIEFRSPSRTFEFDANGVAQITGISPEDLRLGNVRLLDCPEGENPLGEA